MCIAAKKEHEEKCLCGTQVTYGKVSSLTIRQIRKYMSARYISTLATTKDTTNKDTNGSWHRSA